MSLPGTELHTPRYLVRRRAVKAALRRLGPGRFLEMGCGRGEMLAMFHELGMRGYAVEVSDSVIQQAQASAQAVGHGIQVVQSLDLVPADDFDYLLSFEVLEHIENDVGELREWLTRLSPNGSVVITVPAHMKLWSAADESVGHVRRYERQDLIGLLESVGLEPVSISSFGYPLVLITRPLRHLYHRLRPAGATGAERTKNSSLDSTLPAAAPLRPLARALMGLAAGVFYYLGVPLSRTDFGDGYVAVARRARLMTEAQPLRRSPAAGSLRWRIVRAVFGAAGLVFAIAALRGDWRDLDVSAWSAGPAILALACIVATTLMGARVWAAVAPTESRKAARRGYYSSIVGKYIPGGLFQAAGQIGYAARDGASVTGAASSLALSMMTTLAAALVLAGTLATVGEQPAWVRLAGLASLIAGLFAVRRRLILTAAARVLRILRRDAPSSLPSQGQVSESIAWAVWGLAALGAAFAIIASQLAPAIPWWATFTSFAGAWLVGFVALPFPAGIGVREAVLAGLLSPWAATSAVVAVSLGHRVVTIVAELLVYLMSRWSGGRAATPSTPGQS